MRQPSSSDALMLKKLADYKWQLVAVALLAGGMAMSRGGAAALMPLVKFIVPVVVAVVLFKLVKKKVMASAGDLIKKKMEEMARMQQGGGMPGNPGARAASKGGRVLDMCPKCGTMMAPGHRCR